MKRDATYGLHESMGYLVNRLAGTMHAEFDRRTESLEVTAAQWAVLIALYNGDAASPGELARFIGIDGAAVTRLLDRMESKGLVERGAHESDRRAVTVSLSAAGRALTPEVARISQAENDRFLDALTESEGREFLRLLKKLVGSLDG